MNRNNQWGHLLFSLNNRVKESKVFILAQQRLIGDEQEKKVTSTIYQGSLGDVHR